MTASPVQAAACRWTRRAVVHLSGFEADAYARWAGARLPTEAEWEHAARHFDLRARTAISPTGLSTSRPAHGPRRRAAADVRVGLNGRSRPMRPIPLPAGRGGRRINGKFMQPARAARGSCATPAGHVRASYRNFFPPDAQWQFSGLRPRATSETAPRRTSCEEPPSSPAAHPVGSFGGSLRAVPVEELAATVARAVVQRSGIDPGRIDDVVFAQSYAQRRNALRRPLGRAAGRAAGGCPACSSTAAAAAGCRRWSRRR